LDYKEFAQRWVKNLMESMDALLAEQTRFELMEACGRACARTGPARVAGDCQGNLDQRKMMETETGHHLFNRQLELQIAFFKALVEEGELTSL
jgi:hypothetical protein